MLKKVGFEYVTLSAFGLGYVDMYTETYGFFHILSYLTLEIGG